MNKIEPKEIHEHLESIKFFGAVIFHYFEGQIRQVDMKQTIQNSGPMVIISSQEVLKVN